jgi:hypothetical protein
MVDTQYKEMMVEIEDLFDPETDVIEVTLIDDKTFSLHLFTTNKKVAKKYGVKHITNINELASFGVESWTLLDIEDVA